MEQQEVVVACARAAGRWLKKPPEHHQADRHRKAWAAAKTLSLAVVSVSRAGFSLRGPAEALIPLARITRWGHDASDFFVETAAAAQAFLCLSAWWCSGGFFSQRTAALAQATTTSCCSMNHLEVLWRHGQRLLARTWCLEG